MMFNDEDPYGYDDDERFYEETAYNEEHYIEREQEMIRQSNLELGIEELEERHNQRMREEGLLLFTPVETRESETDAEKKPAADQPDDEIPFDHSLLAGL